MSSTAFDDQFAPEPDLEEECRQARARASNVCVWEFKRWVFTAKVQCKGEWVKAYFDDYVFCPYCGRKIEVKK
jgi:hypothetical protein